jgi:hypothetical protein
MSTTRSITFTGPTQSAIDAEIRAYVAKLDELVAFGPDANPEPVEQGYPCWAEINSGDPMLIQAIDYFIGGNPANEHMLQMSLQVGIIRAITLYKAIERVTNFDLTRLRTWRERLEQEQR